MKKEDESSNGAGIVSVVFGILSIIFSITVFGGFLFGIISFVFALVQHKKSPNKWSKSGFVLAIIGIVLGVGVLLLFKAGVNSLQQKITECIANPQLPGCEQISSLIQQQAAAGVR